MSQPDFVYRSASDPAGLPLGVAIYADRQHVRDDLRGDSEAAGLAVRQCDTFGVLSEREPRALGEVTLVDCPQVDAAALAALARLDVRAARAGTQLVVSTSVAGLEDVFACCDQSGAQILVDPTRVERILALGRAVARISGGRLRELSDPDRLALLRLTEQVDRIAEKLDQLGAVSPGIFGDDRLSYVESPAQRFRGLPETAETERLSRSPRPALPDPRLVRRIIGQRQLRARFFDPQLFADPAWDILLDLTAARAEHTRVSVTSLCIASGVPPTTALRWIGQMTETGLLERVRDDSDRRRAFIALSDKAAERMATYFAALGGEGPRLT